MYLIPEMIRSNPHEPFIDADLLANCIAACLECVQACTSCADACLGEDDPGALVRCVRLNLDCAGVCAMTQGVLSRQHDPELALVAMVLQLCAKACKLCALECELHAREHEHCRICGELCRRCESACRYLLRAFPEPSQATEMARH